MAGGAAGRAKRHAFDDPSHRLLPLRRQNAPSLREVWPLITLPTRAGEDPLCGDPDVTRYTPH